LDQTKNVRHIAIDMQRLVAEKTAWYSPAALTILPNVVRLSAALRERSLYARFTVPYDVGEAHGSWKAFYRRWPMVTGQVLDPALLDLVAPLAELAGPDQIFDKLGYSIFSAPTLGARLQAGNIDTLILSGVETDVCVYSSALAAVDLGYTVVLAADALASPDDQAHHAVLSKLAPRLPEQIKVMSTDAILKAYATP
jgi:nicotinamidase-related amidase